jgi:hypothetical protein
MGQPVRAAQLFGAAEGLRARIGALGQPSERAVYEESVASVRAALGENAFSAAWAEGRAMTLEQAIAEAECWRSDLETAAIQPKPAQKSE